MTTRRTPSFSFTLYSIFQSCKNKQVYNLCGRYNLNIWNIKIGGPSKPIEFQFIDLSLPGISELRLEPTQLRKIMDLTENKDFYQLFINLSEVEPPIAQNYVDKQDFITIIARSKAFLPYGLVIGFKEESVTFKIVALWPKSFASACYKRPKLLNNAIENIIESPSDFLSVSIYSTAKK